MQMLPHLAADRAGRGGDQESFAKAGYPAVRFIETVESPNAGQAGSHQHTDQDLPASVTPAYAARMTQVVVSVAASLARAPGAPVLSGITGPAGGPWTVSWSAPSVGPSVDHYVLAARPTTESFYGARVAVPGASASQTVSSSDLDLAGGSAFYVSVAAVDAAGHESLFAPEYRCDSAGCVAK
jgi:hypothetical protein